MTISAKSMFDIGSEGRFASEGVEFFRGWNIASDPLWSRDHEAVLRFDADRFPESGMIVLKLQVFHPETTPPKTLHIVSEGHDPVEMAVPPSGVLSVPVRTPVMQPGATCGFVRMMLSATDSPARLGLSQDDRLLGFHILSVIEDVTLSGFPLNMTRPGIAEAILISGWDRVEEGIGTWSIAAEAWLVLPGYIDLSGARALRFELDTLLRPKNHPPLQVALWHKDRRLETWSFEGSPGGTYECPLGTPNRGEDVEITFRFDNLASPQSLGINADRRELGILLKSIGIVT